MHGSADKELTEILARDVPRLIRSPGGSRTFSYPLADGTSIDVYIELLRPPPTLLVFGAGAVAIPLVTFARALGFRTIVIDGRPRFATRERFPDAEEIRIGIASEIAQKIELGPLTPVVLVAHDYKYDIPVLEKALKTDAPYIGLLGSRRRGAAILQMLRENGVAEEQLQRVRVLIGLDLGGETAAEIALSIVSEVVAVMHGKSGSALSSGVAITARNATGNAWAKRFPAMLRLENSLQVPGVARFLLDAPLCLTLRSPLDADESIDYEKAFGTLRDRINPLQRKILEALAAAGENGLTAGQAGNAPRPQRSC